MSSQLVTIKILETFLHEGRYEEGETRKVAPSLAAYFCKLGWAEDVDGNIPTQTRQPGAARIQPADINIPGGVDNG